MWLLTVAGYESKYINQFSIWMNSMFYIYHEENGNLHDLKDVVLQALLSTSYCLLVFTQNYYGAIVSPKIALGGCAPPHQP